MQWELHVADWTVLQPTPKVSPQDHIVKMGSKTPEFSHESQELFKKCPAGENVTAGI